MRTPSICNSFTRGDHARDTFGPESLFLLFFLLPTYVDFRIPLGVRYTIQLHTSTRNRAKEDIADITMERDPRTFSSKEKASVTMKSGRKLSDICNIIPSTSRRRGFAWYQRSYTRHPMRGVRASRGRKILVSARRDIGGYLREIAAALVFSSQQ